MINRHVILLGVIFLMGCSSRERNSDKIDLKDIKLESLKGETYDLTSLKGKKIFLNFWATWCKPCLMEMPSIEKAMARLKSENIVFLFASDEEVNQIMDFKNARKFEFEYVRILNLAELSIQALPTTFIFNENGELVFSEMGYRDWSSDENIKIIKSNNE